MINYKQKEYAKYKLKIPDYFSHKKDFKADVKDLLGMIHKKLWAIAKIMAFAKASSIVFSKFLWFFDWSDFLWSLSAKLIKPLRISFLAWFKQSDY